MPNEALYERFNPYKGHSLLRTTPHMSSARRAAAHGTLLHSFDRAYLPAGARISHQRRLRQEMPPKYQSDISHQSPETGTSERALARGENTLLFPVLGPLGVQFWVSVS